MKRLLTFIATIFICCTAYAETYAGLNYALSDPKGYSECPCPPDFQIKPIRADIESRLLVLKIGHEFTNGIFVEGRHGRGLNKSGSVVNLKDGISFPGIDVEVDHFSYIGVGYSFFSDEPLSPYVSVGKMLNFVMSGYDPESGTQISRENYNGTSFGAGVNWTFSEDWDLNLDYQNYARGDYGDAPGIDFSTISAGFSYRF